MVSGMESSVYGSLRRVSNNLIDTPRSLLYFQVVMRRLLLLFAMLLVGCDRFPRKVAMDDPRIQPLLKAAASFDRTSYGFTPIPASAEVRFESHSTERYDAMLHIDSKTSRTIAFRKSERGYRWTGEQETFQGPNQYTTVDGTFYEHITLTYEIEAISGFPINQINVTYSGEDPRLEFPKKPTLATVRPILKEWGYPE
jgi:hypothetical protein